MNILVCISRVPDTTSKISPASDKLSIDSQGLKFIINPYDEFAIEEALRIREQKTAKITVLCFGTEAAKDVLRTALALSVDRAVLIKSDLDADSNSIARNIADFAKNENFDLILTGKQSIDYSSASMPNMLSALLDMPAVTVVTKLTIGNGKLEAEREIEGGTELVEAAMPCIISTQKGLNDPRYPKLPDIMKAKAKPIEEIIAKQYAQLVNIESMETLNKARIGKILGDSSEDIAELIHLLRNEAKLI